MTLKNRGSDNYIQNPHDMIIDQKITTFVNSWGLEGIPLLAFGSTANRLENAIDNLLVELNYLNSLLSDLNVSDTAPFIEETLKFISKERDYNEPL